MTKTTMAILGATIATAAVPAIAQGAPQLQTLARAIGAAPKLSAKAQPAVNGRLAEPKEAWSPMTAAAMSATLPRNKARTSYSLSTPIDYNADGTPDLAYMATSGPQIAIIVQLGGGKGRVVAYRAQGQWGGGAEIAAAGSRRILVSFPESSVVVLSSESGRPAAYFYGD